MDEKLILERLERIERLLTILVNDKNKPVKTKGKPTKTWLPAAWVMKVTGRSKNEMMQARDSNIIVFKGRHRAIRYLLESIPEQYIIKK